MTVRNLVGEFVQQLFEFEMQQRDVLEKQFTMEHLPSCHVTPYDISVNEIESFTVMDETYDVHYEVACAVCEKRRVLIMIRETPLKFANETAELKFQWKQAVFDL